jgi:S-adenosylmethionine:tRNA ribosyltransferase-isomerase
MSAPAQLADTAEFLYDLPPELIAAHPAKPRGTSRLLVHVPAQPLAGEFANNVDTLASTVSSGGTTLPEGCGTAYDLSFVQLSSVMPRAAHLVFNESRVFAARVRATAASPPTVAIAARIEVLFLSPLSYADPAAALASPADGQLWRAMVRAPLAHRGGTGDGGVGVGRDGFAARLEVRSAETVMQLTVEKVLAPWVEAGEGDGVEAAIRLSLRPASWPDGQLASLPLSDLLERLGQTPLPPYIQRAPLPSDVAAYQTVYADAAQTGSVAAPTAGLHFTPGALASLAARGVASSYVTLHVGAATFKPVSAPTIGGHHMHAEPFSVTSEALEGLERSAAEGRPIVPVGTTSARLLESLYWLAVAAARQNGGAGCQGEPNAHGISLRAD